MGRDTGEQPTRQDGIDLESLTGVDDPAERDYRDDRPQLVPDRGAQPRYRRQTTDAFGQARRRNDPYQGCDTEGSTYGDEPKRFDVWKQLTLIAQEHALKLRHYRADRCAAIIDREVTPQVRKILRSVAPPDRVEALLADFIELLWSEVEKK